MQVCKEEQLTMEQKEHKCAWCNREGEMEFCSKKEPKQYFCNTNCLHKWEWFNGNGQDWLNVEEKNNGKKKS